MARKLTIFDGNDDVYQEWLATNPRGYIINARRNLSPSYMVLHRAWCKSIRNYSVVTHKGGFTERAYIKICAPRIDDLRNWLRRHGRPDSTFSNECSRCNYRLIHRQNEFE